MIKSNEKYYNLFSFYFYKFNFLSTEMTSNILSKEIVEIIKTKCQLKSAAIYGINNKYFGLKRNEYYSLIEDTSNNEQREYKLMPKYFFNELYKQINELETKHDKSTFLNSFTDDIYGIWVYTYYTSQFANDKCDKLKYASIKLDGNNIDDFIKDYIECNIEYNKTNRRRVYCFDWNDNKTYQKNLDNKFKLTDEDKTSLQKLAEYLKSKMNIENKEKNHFNKFAHLAIKDDISLDSEDESIEICPNEDNTSDNEIKTNDNEIKKSGFTKDQIKAITINEEESFDEELIENETIIQEPNKNIQQQIIDLKPIEDDEDTSEYEPIISQKIIKLISEKHKIPMDNKDLKKVLHRLENKECEYKKLDKSILKTITIKKDILSSFGIKNINQEISDALCCPNYNEDNLKPLSDIELYTDYVDTTSYNNPEYQLIIFLKWCVIYADYKSYIITKTIYKTVNDFKFKSTDYKEVVKEIKELDSELFNKINILAYDFSGGFIKLDTEQYEWKINWCNKFMENRFIKIIMPAHPNSLLYKHWCQFLDNPIKITNKIQELETTNQPYCNFLVQLYNYHKNIARFIPNPVIMPKEKCNGQSSAFAQSLLSYRYNKPLNIDDIFDENHAQYYMVNDISERLTCMLKRCSFDLDINKNTFELPKLKQDLTFIINYLLKPIDDIKIYYAIDINKTINSTLIIKELDKLIANDSNKSHEHQYKYWVLDQSKDVSIHVYVSGVYFTDMQLFGLGRIIHQAINSYHLFYIDASTYKCGSQQFRCPFSGKMACGRNPVERTNERYSKDDLIEFYKHCSVYPTLNDKYCNKFECFMEHCNDKCRKNKTIKNTTPVSVFTAHNKETVRNVKNIDKLYKLHPVEFDKPTQLLIDMMIKTVKKIFGYDKHRPARLMLLNNVIALGGNMANILEINAELGIQHTNKTITINTQNNDDCNWILSTNKNGKFIYNGKLLYKNEKPIMFPMNSDIKKILFYTPLSIDIANILARHYYAFVDEKHVYYFDTIQNQFTGQPEINLKGPFSTYQQMPTSKFNIYTENGLISINPYHYFSSPNIEMHHYATVGFSNNKDCLNIYPLDIPETKDHKTFDELYRTYPNFYKLLFRIFNDTELEQQEVNNRITYFLNSICYAIQNPQRVKPKGLLINTQNSAGKTQLMNIFKDCFNELVLTGKTLDGILSDSFNEYMVNRVIVCCEELKPNQDYDKLKEWMDAKFYAINQKNKDIVHVPNTSIKIFYSNNKHFNFIKENDRRFVVFRSSIPYSNNIDPEIAKLFNISEERTQFINYLKDYLINYDTKDFNPNNANLIPQSCIDEYKSICEDNDANENYNVGFIKQIYKSCVVPTLIKDNTKCMTLQHIFDIIKLIMEQCKNKYDYEFLSDQEKLLFVDKESYDDLCDFVLSHYEPEKQKWFINKITKIIANETNFVKTQYRKHQLNIPEFLNQKYNLDKIRVIKYSIFKIDQ